MVGKCPKCDALVRRLEINLVDGTVPLSQQRPYRCITFNCPSCKAVLGTQVDPAAVITDTIDELMNALRKTK